MELGRSREAIDHLGQALEIVEERMGPDHPEAAGVLTDLGRAHLRMQRAEDAAGFLERAVTLLAERGVRPRDLARARFLLARALWPRDRDRALELAREARSGLGALGEEARAEAQQVEEWLSPRQAVAEPG
jgi:hypothetical protein